MIIIQSRTYPESTKVKLHDVQDICVKLPLTLLRHISTFLNIEMDVDFSSHRHLVCAHYLNPHRVAYRRFGIAIENRADSTKPPIEKHSTINNPTGIRCKQSAYISNISSRAKNLFTLRIYPKYVTISSAYTPRKLAQFHYTTHSNVNLSKFQCD